jgi:hypothetical protein
MVHGMAMTEAQRTALTQMLDTTADLDRWRLRAHRVEVSEPGSDLALDDEIVQRMEISQSARHSLVAAGEHLRLALDAINAKQLYPSSHFTVLRGRWSAHLRPYGSWRPRIATCVVSEV